MIQPEREMKNFQGLGRRHRLVDVVGARPAGKTTFKVNGVKIMEIGSYDKR